MTCGGCENAVTRSLLRTPGITEAAASHVDGLVEVTFDPAVVTRAAILEKIAALGYVVGE